MAQVLAFHFPRPQGRFGLTPASTPVLGPPARGIGGFPTGGPQLRTVAFFRRALRPYQIFGDTLATKLSGLPQLGQIIRQNIAEAWKLGHRPHLVRVDIGILMGLPQTTEPTLINSVRSL